MKKLQTFITLIMVVTLSLSGLAYGNVQDNGSIVRLAGNDRYETAAKIALDAYPDGATTVILARGDIFADGLAGSALAGALGAPILLTNSNRLSSSTAKAMETLGAKEVVLLGGPGAISEAVKSELEEMDIEVTRIFGDDRFDTAVKIAKEIAETLGDDFPDTAIIVSGTAMADSLVAGTIAAMHYYPTLMVKRDSVPQLTADVLTALGIKNLFVIGGNGVISDAVYSELEGLVDGDVERVWGDDRSATSVAVARRFFSNPNPSQVILANGRTLVDALAGGYMGALRNAPILLTQSLPDVVAEYIEEIATQDTLVYILGGTAAVGNSVANQVQGLIPKPPPPVVGPGPAPGPTTYALTVVAEGGTVTGAGSYSSGATVNLTVTTNDGYVFSHWTATAGSFSDANTAQTTFTMPSEAVTVVANFNMLFAGGDGTAGSPFLITEPEHLDNVRYFLGAYFRLENDIDFDDSWVPIGYDPVSPADFTGHFDGAGFSIIDLEITGVNYVGLFYKIKGSNSEANVKNLTLSDVRVSGVNNVGSLAGSAKDAVFENCHATNVRVDGTGQNVGGLIGLLTSHLADEDGEQDPGNVAWIKDSTVTSAAVGGVDSYYVGGLVGNIGPSVTVERCHAVEAVVTGKYNVGGLVGTNSGDIISSYATATVTCSQDSAGGLVGYNNGDIRDCHSGGTVTGDYVGGLVGGNDSSISNSYSIATVTIIPDGSNGIGGGLVGGSFGGGTITNCYAAGWVITTNDDPTEVGGLVGVNSSDVTTSYYDQVATDMSDEGKGEGKTPEQMRTQTQFPWNFSEVWTIDEGVTYPYLRSHNYHHLPGYPLFADGRGTQADPYLIETAQHLHNVRYFYDSYFKLVDNIDLNFANWEPIGTGDKAFSGHLDGNGKTISNLRIERDGNSFVGLFGAIGRYGKTTSVKNLTLQTVRITKEGGAEYSTLGNYTGALAGHARRATIDNCHVRDVVVDGNQYVGGLLGGSMGAESIIINCTVQELSVSGRHSIGGLVGINSDSAVINKCSVVGSEPGSSDLNGGVNIGGLVGANYGTIISSYASTYVRSDADANAYAGGLVGINFSSIEKSYAEGTVEALNYLGGLVGRSGSASSGTIVDSYSLATVVIIASDGVGGGLVGWNLNRTEDAIRNCYAAGHVQTNGNNNNAGGLIGLNDDIDGVVNVANSFYDWNNTFMSDEGKGERKTTRQMKTWGTFTGWDLDIWSIGSGDPYSYPYLKDLVPNPLPGNTLAWFDLECTFPEDNLTLSFTNAKGADGSPLNGSFKVMAYIVVPEFKLLYDDNIQFEGGVAEVTFALSDEDGTIMYVHIDPGNIVDFEIVILD